MHTTVTPQSPALPTFAFTSAEAPKGQEKAKLEDIPLSPAPITVEPSLQCPEDQNQLISLGTRFKVAINVYDDLHERWSQAISPGDLVEVNIFKELTMRIRNKAKSFGLHPSHELKAYLSNGEGSEPEIRLCRHKIEFDECLNRGFTHLRLVATYLSGELLASPTAQEEIFSKLHDARIMRKDKIYFIPDDKISEILSGDLLEQICNEISENGAILTIDELRDKGSKLLATLILAHVKHLGKVFNGFWQIGWRDQQMPFDRDSYPQFCTHNEWNDIYDHQGQVLDVPVKLIPIGQKDKPQEFREHDSLPFTEIRELGKGGFGTVWEIQMDIHHKPLYKVTSFAESHDGSRKYPNNPRLALKKLNRPHKTRNDRETDILKQVGQLGDDHIIRLITAFYHGKDYYLLFPLAKCNLGQCFATEDHKNDSRYTLWILGQLCGVANALNKIHSEVARAGALEADQPQLGYHNDVSPSNFLVFTALKETLGEGSRKFGERNNGRIQIADFGLGKLVQRVEGISPNSNTVAGQETYAAPECYRETGRKVSRPKDIWALGCTILEIWTWLVEGRGATTKFAHDRSGPIDAEVTGFKTEGYFVYSTDEKGKRVPGVRDAVIDQIKKLESHTIANTMLNNPQSQPKLDKTAHSVMKLVRKCLKVVRESRPRASEVVKDLESIYDEFEKEVIGGTGVVTY